MDDLDRYLDSLIDLDGVRYRLVGLEEREVLLAEPDETGTTATGLIRMRRDYVAEGVTHVLRAARRAGS